MVAAEDLPQDLVFVDLETTGGSAAYDRITEVGLVRTRNGELVEEWSSLVNPGRPIPAYIEDFTGISNQMVAGAPRFAEIASVVQQKLRGAVFIAHNARFDYSFLRSEFLKSDMTFSAKVLCTRSSASAARSAVLSLSMIGRGVPAGASSMCQKSRSSFL